MSELEVTSDSERQLLADLVAHKLARLNLSLGVSTGGSVLIRAGKLLVTISDAGVELRHDDGELVLETGDLVDDDLLDACSEGSPVDLLLSEDLGKDLRAELQAEILSLPGTDLLRGKHAYWSMPAYPEDPGSMEYGDPFLCLLDTGEELVLIHALRCGRSATGYEVSADGKYLYSEGPDGEIAEAYEMDPKLCSTSSSYFYFIEDLSTWARSVMVLVYDEADEGSWDQEAGLLADKNLRWNGVEDFPIISLAELPAYVNSLARSDGRRAPRRELVELFTKTAALRD